MTLADRLKDSRKALGLSQAQLADQCGVSQPTIANWERGGHVPRQKALHRIGACLDVEPVWLLSGEQPPHKNPAHQHLTKPIHHIPVFDWTDDLDTLNGSTPSQYLTTSSVQGDIIAMIAPRKSRFPDRTTLIFDRNQDQISGDYLLSDNGQLTIRNIEMSANDDQTPAGLGDAQIIGRLVMSVSSH